MKTKVLNLHERGVVPAAIADTLNVSDRRVNQSSFGPLELIDIFYRLTMRFLTP